MKKSEKIIIACGAALTIAMGAATAVIIANSNREQSDDLDMSTAVYYTEGDGVILTELKVGKYYLQGGTESEYIEVYPDKTICIFGLGIDEDATEGQREDALAYETRKYYVLYDRLPSIRLSDTPDASFEDARVNGKTKGYSYLSENIISFTDVVDGEYVRKLYVYHAE